MSIKISVTRQAAISAFIRTEQGLEHKGGKKKRTLLQTYGKKEEAEFELGCEKLIGNYSGKDIKAAFIFGSQIPRIPWAAAWSLISW